jgi:hypothetical protein
LEAADHRATLLMERHGVVAATGRSVRKTPKRVYFDTIALGFG